MQEKQGGNSGIVAQFKRFFSGYSVIVITVILFIVAGIFQGQNFLSPQNIINVLRNNAVLGILALGMAFVIIVGEIDLSVGAELVIVASICLAVLNATQNIVLAVIVTMACAIGFSTGMGVIVAKGKGRTMCALRRTIPSRSFSIFHFQFSIISISTRGLPAYPHRTR